MFCSFEDAFNPSEEKISLYKKTILQAMKKGIEDKKCWMCSNTYLESYNNHGNKDCMNICIFTKECVDYDDGLKCPNWNPREIECS